MTDRRKRSVGWSGRSGRWRAPAGHDGLLVVGLAVAATIAVALRVPHLLAGLPEVLHVDESQFAGHAADLLDGPFAPTTDGMQPLVINLLAAVTGIARLLGADAYDRADIVALGRITFVVVGLAAVGSGTVVASVLADSRADRRVETVGTALVLAVSYQMVRLGRSIVPDTLQLACVAGSFLCIVRFDRTRSWKWLAAAGFFGGLAGAAKYVGVFVVLAAVASILWHRSRLRTKARQLALAALSTIIGFFAGAPTVLADPVAFADGIITQFTRQTVGHLGYEPEGNGWWFHLGTTLPGNWGALLTAAGVIGAAWIAWNGTRAQRLSLAAVLPLFLLLGAFQSRLPYYPVILMPFLAAYAFVAATRLGRLLGAWWVWAIPAVLVLSLAPTLVSDLRLIRATGAPDTRSLANDVLTELPGPVWAESYTASELRPGDVQVGRVFDRGTTECDCVVLISSYWEERYRRRPDLYTNEIEAYDEVREGGPVLEVIAPDHHLPYRWDLLPGWGIQRIPLTGDIGPVGPTITIIDLRESSDRP